MRIVIMDNASAAVLVRDVSVEKVAGRDAEEVAQEVAEAEGVQLEEWMASAPDDIDIVIDINGVLHRRE